VVFSDFIRDPGVEFHGLWAFMLHGVSALPFWLALAGIATAWWLYRVRTDLPKKIAMRLGVLYAVVERKYGFDELYAWLFGAGARVVGTGLWKAGDQTFIDGLAVNGSARLVGWFSALASLLQSGMLYRYAGVMLLGVVFATYWFLRI
jgi:NADH-quinone oxidoreductase subunit L